jgi:hypothetical protein
MGLTCPYTYKKEGASYDRLCVELPTATIAYIRLETAKYGEIGDIWADASHATPLAAETKILTTNGW